MNGVIFDIKECSMHDGPGIRTTVFFKGCPLRCRWCHNPEGLSSKIQLMYKKSKCSGCGRCKVKCEHKICRQFNRCVYACPNDCLSVSGRVTDETELARQILKQKDLLQALNGGVTLSGGEPLMQWEFVCSLIERINELHVAIQTSGYATEDIYKKVIDRVDFVMQDIKIFDSAEHKKYTGVENGIILKNINYLMNSNKEFVLRVPLIPGITDTEKNLTEISNFVDFHRVELLRYNSFAGAKYDMLGMKYGMENAESQDGDYTKYFKNATML